MGRLSGANCVVTTPQHSFTRSGWCLCLRGIVARLLRLTYLWGEVDWTAQHRASACWQVSRREPGDGGVLRGRERVAQVRALSLRSAATAEPGGQGWCRDGGRCGAVCSRRDAVSGRRVAGRPSLVERAEEAESACYGRAATGGAAAVPSRRVSKLHVEAAMAAFLPLGAHAHAHACAHARHTRTLEGG